MKTILFLLPNLLWNSGVLEPSLTLGESGVALQGHTGSAITGGSFAALRGSFALQKTEDARISGWAWGFTAGASSSLEQLDRALAPATYFWEASFGRGTTESFTGGESGLRGYLEAALRDQRTEPTSELNQILTANGYDLKDHNTALVFRMGAARDYAGRGLVEQGPPKVLFRLQTSLYLPLLDQSANRVFLGINGTGLIRCGIGNLSCGVELGFLQSSNADGAGELYEAYRHFTYGPSFEMKWKEKYALKIKAQWTSVTGRKGKFHVTRWSASPAIDGTFTLEF